MKNAVWTFCISFLLSASPAAAQPAGGPNPDSQVTAKSSPFFALCMEVKDAKKRNLQEQAAMLKELGYDGVGHLWLDDVAQRLATLDATGLKLFQIYMRADLRPEAKQAYDPRLKETLPLLAGRGTVLALLIIGGKPSDESVDGRAVEIIREIAGLANPHGVSVALYPHKNHWLEKVTDAVRVARKVDLPNVGVMFNLCHWMASEDEKGLDSLLDAAAPLLLGVTICGSDTPEEVKAKTGKWIQPLDSGSYDLLPLLKKLKERGYKGPIGLQCFGLPGDAAEHLARSMAAWRKLNARLLVPAEPGKQ